MSSHEPARPGRPDDQRCPRHSRVDALLVKVGEGDRDAFAALYDEMHQTVFAMGLLSGHESHRAAEVTFDVFVDAWRQAPMYDPQVQSGWAWVHGLAETAMSGERRGHTSRRRDVASAVRATGGSHG